MSAKIVILQHRLLHYRVEFFEQLRSLCEQRGIELKLLHGQASESENSRNDEGSLPWATKVINRYWRVRGKELLWQPIPGHLRDADLFILMQENRILSNYPFLVLPHKSNLKVAYWGHGVNFQSRRPNGPSELWKRHLARRVDWWFAYTQVTVNYLLDIGYPHERITCLNNAIDTSALRDEVSSVSEQELNMLNHQYGIAGDAIVGVFCGSLYPDKKLDFLVQACDIITRNEPGFKLIVIGAGPSKSMLENAARTRTWMHLAGVRKGREKAIIFKRADVMLNPGALGLHILDAFSIGMPLVSTKTARHGPEIVYLQDGVNGILTDENKDAYAAAVTRLLTDSDFCKRIGRNALSAGKNYTVERMAYNFVEGIVACLNTDGAVSYDGQNQ